MTTEEVASGEPAKEAEQIAEISEESGALPVEAEQAGAAVEQLAEPEQMAEGSEHFTEPEQAADVSEQLTEAEQVADVVDQPTGSQDAVEPSENLPSEESEGPNPKAE
jgi:hypothetical protein